MSDRFSPESPRLSSRYKRAKRDSARRRTVGLIIVLLALIVLYYIGCSQIKEIPY